VEELGEKIPPNYLQNNMFFDGGKIATVRNIHFLDLL